MNSPLEIAAQCWCDKRTEKVVMIPELAEVFTEALLSYGQQEYERGIREAAKISMDHGGMEETEIMWKACGGEIAKKILSLLDQNDL